MLTLAQLNWSQWFLAVMLIVVCGFLMLVILLQRGRGGGLSAAFGGGGGSSAFGAKTGDVFTWITVVVAALFLLLAVVANFVFDLSVEHGVEAAPAATTAPVTTTTPTTTTVPVDTAPPPVGPPAPGGEAIKVVPAGQIKPGDETPATAEPTRDGTEEQPRP